MSSSSLIKDQLQRFSFDHTDIRGELAHLDRAYQEVIERHQYPEIIAVSLGELMAATALLSANLKFKGRLTLQVRLKGSVSLLQAETDEQGRLRAIARYDEAAEVKALTFSDGNMVITIEPEVGQKYQGITLIEGGNIAAALEAYFFQSEQLPTKFWLVSNGQSAAGLMLQKLPAQQEQDEDAWGRVSHLASTIKQEELLFLDNETLLHRLYHEESVRIYPASELSFFCNCSKDRIGKALSSLGYDELQSILEEQSVIRINCEFCQQAYSFDQAQVEGLFPERHVQ